MRMKPTLAAALWVMALVQAWAAPAARAADPYIPEPLAPWVQWVVEGSPEAACTRRHDGAGAAGCAWPGRLELMLDAGGGTFAQKWSVEAPSWVSLPGSPEHWPVEVRVDEEPALVSDRDSAPSLHLAPGEYEVTGSFRWSSLPAHLAVPPSIAIVHLAVNGAEAVNPVRDDDGAVALAGEAAAPGETDRVEVAVFRRLIDERPFQVHTRLSVDVSGAAREIVLPRPFLPDSRPLRLEGPLPIRLLADGRVRIQVRPGRWEFDLFSRLPGAVESVSRREAMAPLPAEEVWSFDARRELRDVRLGGLAPVDPRQTRMPPEWRDLPAFLAASGASLRLAEETMEAAAAPADQLTLTRELWLDFDGSGFTAQDRLSGIAHGDRRLESDAPVALGRVTVNGEPRFITRLREGGPHGVEVRAGPLDVVADMRITPGERLPVAGWNRDLAGVDTTLHLPPGWRLAAAPGAERVHGAWLDQWSMLDMFMVLVLSIGAFRAFGPAAGVLALGALALSWQSPGAPQYVWVPLLLTCVLINLVRPGRLRTLLAALRAVAVVAVVVVAAPYLVHTARMVVFPQLEHGEDFIHLPGVRDLASTKARAPGRIAESAAPQPMVLQRMDTADAAVGMAVPDAPVRRIDTALIQTGPGVPEWRFNRYQLGWGGPVTTGDEYRLVLLPPLVNRVLDLARFLLVALLIAVLIRNRPTSGRGQADAAGASAPTAVAVLASVLAATLLPASPAAGEAHAAEFPPPALLDELADRVLAEPECSPDCVSLQSVLVTADEREIRVFFELTALADVAVPLLERAPTWSASTVEVDGQGASALGTGEGMLVSLDAGHRLVELSGPVGAVDEVLLTFPLRPHRLAVQSTEWRASGMERAGGTDRQLRLSRRLETSAGPVVDEGPAAQVEPFFEVTRTLVLGADIRVVTEVARLSEPRPPVTVEVPLVPGESPLTDMPVTDGVARIAMDAGQTWYSWESVLQTDGTVELVAPDDHNRVERWQIDADPRWHVVAEGLDPVLAGGEAGPVRTWRPLPGQALLVTMLRPEGVPGNTLTLDQSRLRLVPGPRSTRGELSVSVRSSQGGIHTVTLPEGVQVREVRIDGAAQPVDPGRREIVVPLAPGTRQVAIEWLADGGMEGVYRTPAVDLGAESVNASVALVPDAGRWLLWVQGPALGPAILYWGVLLFVLAAALALSRIAWLPVKWWQWLLLGAGLGTGNLWTLLPVVAWFLLVGARARLPADGSKAAFNLAQIAVVLATPVLLWALFEGVRTGLLGHPDMQVAGNGSTTGLLSWYADRSGTIAPQATVISVPLLAYRLLMLAWALWLAFSVIGWLRWGWRGFTTGGAWRRIAWKRRKAQAAAG